MKRSVGKPIQIYIYIFSELDIVRIIIILETVLYSVNIRVIAF